MYDILKLIIDAFVKVFDLVLTHIAERKKGEHVYHEDRLNVIGFNNPDRIRSDENQLADISLNFIYEDHVNYIDVENVGTEIAYDVYVKIVGNPIKIRPPEFLTINCMAPFEHCRFALPELTCSFTFDVVVIWCDREYAIHGKTKRLVGSL